MIDLTQTVKKFNTPVTAQTVARELGVKKNELPIIKKELYRLVREGKLAEKNGRFLTPEKTGLLEGTVASTATGADFFVSESLSGDLKITRSRDFAAMNNDRVLVRMRGSHCEIVKILERANKKIVGTVRKDGQFSFVEPDDKKLHEIFILPKSERAKASVGDKVVAFIKSYPTGKTNGICKIEENLGSENDDSTAILSVLRSYGVEDHFAENILSDADQLPDEISPRELQSRLDLRKLPTVTIDGDDAKDLDDAVSLEMTERGDYLLGVHIADVSHYVTLGSLIDTEAAKRATSVYIPGTVFPMLPKKLSNGICSLNPHEDRLTLSCFMVITKQGKIADYHIAPSVINSDHRMTYTEVTEMLENTHSPHRKTYSDVLGMLLLMEKLAEILEETAHKRGSIDFDLPEAKIILDDSNFPESITRYEVGVSNKMIEQFMLAANRTVAAHMRNHALPCVFRVHEPPEEKKLEGFKELIKAFGEALPLNPKPSDFNILLERFAGRDEENLVKKTMLRTMSKAKYKPTCDGHFGLALDDYLHFTSPIRRYPDLIVHRVLHMSFSGQRKAMDEYASRMENLAEICTRREINAAYCERDVTDIRKAQYMSRHIGEEFDGYISGVTPYGMFVELENTVEGFVPIGTVNGYFHYDEARFMLYNDEKRYTMGDSVRIKVSGTTVQSGKVEFSLL